MDDTVSNELNKVLRCEALKDKIVTAEEAASWIEDGMSLGMSGFTLSGDAKAVPLALAERGKNEKFKVNVFTGASLGPNVDELMAGENLINMRIPYQGNPVMRGKINTGESFYIDQHLSHTSEWVRQGVIGPIDYAIIEAAAITEDGQIIPTGSVGNSPIFVQEAKNVIIELNVNVPAEYEGLHDIYIPEYQGDRKEIPVYSVTDKIGTPGIKVDPAKVRGIVITEKMDIPSPIVPPDEETQEIANNLLDFFRDEIKKGRMDETLMPLQSGVGSVANAVLDGMRTSEFKDIEVYSEVLQDAIFDLIDDGVVKFASATSLTLSKKRLDSLKEDIGKYRDKLVFRPQEISNHPEVIRRLGIISFNTALELDIYGNVNSTHVSGTRMMNGIGGSGDFARNARIAIFVTKSYAKGGDVSSIVPFCSHVDHTEHDVDVIVTEQGYADLRGLAPRQKAEALIEHCAHPDFKDELRDYYNRAKEQVGGQTPHILEEALSWHVNLAKNKTMHKAAEAQK
ncbi:acetyl-CoA hydrolase [Sporosarcina sp. NCCP-2331]|nr:acetyl-CoA hydrolase [Sporosarcina sp. NCCP-2331]GLB55296.1 acetyl-CoA hydrolase [Sporosarcina sp. NCCP-2378]